ERTEVERHVEGRIDERRPREPLAAIGLDGRRGDLVTPLYPVHCCLECRGAFICITHHTPTASASRPVHARARSFVLYDGRLGETRLRARRRPVRGRAGSRAG